MVHTSITNFLQQKAISHILSESDFLEMSRDIRKFNMELTGSVLTINDETKKVQIKLSFSTFTNAEKEISFSDYQTTFPNRMQTKYSSPHQEKIKITERTIVDRKEYIREFKCYCI